MDTNNLKGLMEAYSEVYAPQENIDEAIYSEKGKAKAAEMIAKRSTPSGRAKSGKGADVAQIRQIRGSGRGRFDREGLGGTPMTPTMAKNPIKKHNYDGTGNKAARRAAALKNEELDIFDVVLEFLQVEGFAETLEEAEWMMANLLDKETIDIIVEAMHEDEDEEDEKEMKKGKKDKKEDEEEDEEEEEEEDDKLSEASYSAKAARAGKDIGKPGKAFAKIAKSAAKRYGSKERGEKVAGAVLAKLRAKRG